jgi:fructose-1,6-bisphosphatase/inositol monophosphatase family enzyme
MNVPKSAAMETNISLGREMGDVMLEYFTTKNLPQAIKTEEDPLSGKPHRSIVTAGDQVISDRVVAFFAIQDRPVASEEQGGTAVYGTPDAEYLDPINGTKNVVEARRLLDSQSIGAFSLGSAVGGRLVRGVVNFPLLDRPRLYWAEEGRGAFRVMDGHYEEGRLQINPEPTRGIVLVAENNSPHAARLQAAGLTPLKQFGAVFKACCVADPNLLAEYDPQVLPGDAVVGFLSASTQAHDYAAAKVLISEAGGLACSLSGDDLALTAGRHGCLFANSPATRDRILDAII